MRKISEVLRLKYECRLDHRAIARSVGISSSTVSYYIQRAKRAQLSWPLPTDMDEESLHKRLYPDDYQRGQRPLADMKQVHQELRRKEVTLFLLWQEYRSKCNNGYSYSQFCNQYRQFCCQLDPVMRQTHKAGEKLFIDYAGVTLPLTDKQSGVIHKAEIFVAVLGASNYTYVEATRTQSLPDWIASHQRAFQFLGGVVEVLVPDNLKSGVTKAHRYEPDINPTYQEMAEHYQVAVVPARVRKPRDKALAEVGVQIVERQILAPLRHHTFFSIAEINAAIRPLLTSYNQRDFQKLPGSRLSQFEALDKPALKPLPMHFYHYAEWKKATVASDYHIEVNKHRYSVPYNYLRQQVDVRITDKTVEVFHKRQSIASHLRQFTTGQCTTLKAHMPLSHQKQLACNPDSLYHEAESVGQATVSVIERLLASQAQAKATRISAGILRLSKRYGRERLEKACVRALAINGVSYKSIASILKQGLDNQPLHSPAAQSLTPLHHSNIRGEDYYRDSNEEAMEDSPD